jgi:hypothetical protein
MLNFNETIELCLNKNFKQLYMAIEKSTDRSGSSLDESPWRDCGKLERASHLITPVNLDDVSFRDYSSAGGPTDSADDTNRLIDILSLNDQA